MSIVVWQFKVAELSWFADLRPWYLHMCLCRSIFFMWGSLWTLWLGSGKGVTHFVAGGAEVCVLC